MGIFFLYIELYLSISAFVLATELGPVGSV